jgi:hypothetical protein
MAIFYTSIKLGITQSTKSGQHIDVGEKERCRKIHHPVELINQQLNPPVYEMYVKTGKH